MSNSSRLSVTEEESEAVALFRKYDRTALPVVDGRGALIGIVTVDDVLDVQEEEATREIQRFGGLEALEDSYTDTPAWEMIRKRTSWLVVLFVGELFTATAMAHYGEEMHLAEVLVYFIPLIISSGGNSGSQAATLLVRALAVGEIRLRDWFWVMRRELFSGLMLGVLLGTIGFFRIAVWSHFTDIYGPYWLRVAFTVALRSSES